MSPRSAALNEALRAEARARLLGAALRLFARHGFEGTSVRMIAAEARVSLGLLYNYFPSKEAVLRALFDASMDDVQASFAAAAAAPAGARVEHLVRAAFELIRKNLDFWRLSYAVRMQAATIAGLGPALPRFTARILATLERNLAADGVADPAIEARLLFALIDGVAQHYALDPRRYPLGEVTEALVARYRPGRPPRGRSRRPATG